MTATDRFFIDTAPFIYLVEKHPHFYNTVLSYLSNTISQGGAPFTTVVSYTEFCVKPHESGDSKTVLNFEKMLKKIGCPIAPISLPIAKIAYPLRAKYQFLKASDSFQIAAALHLGCKEFLTNDSKLSRITEIKVVLISDLFSS
jgi:predicted nucleic acid-binding protein